jgi:hypothetical protein
MFVRGFRRGSRKSALVADIRAFRPARRAPTCRKSAFSADNHTQVARSRVQWSNIGAGSYRGPERDVSGWSKIGAVPVLGLESDEPRDLRPRALP